MLRSGRMTAVAVLFGCQLYAPVADTDELRAPVIAIIIDDLGYDLAAGERAARLPGPVACSVLPHTPASRRLARVCHRLGKEVLLHLPMQAADPAHDPGTGVLTLRQDREELIGRLTGALEAVPHVTGVNNHMGSLLTRNLATMQWIMAQLRGSGSLFYVDSYTTPASVAMRVARANGLPTARRDVFLDADPDPEAVALELSRLVDEARTAGFALAIGHPLPVTLALLERALPALAADGIMLVSVAELVRRSTVEDVPWLATYSYPSHPASRN
jgi:polysaccharide deacetylase 2 family uncharacterized protein YibQ